MRCSYIDINSPGNAYSIIFFTGEIDLRRSTFIIKNEYIYSLPVVRALRILKNTIKSTCAEQFHVIVRKQQLKNGLSLIKIKPLCCNNSLKMGYLKLSQTVLKWAISLSKNGLSQDSSDCVKMGYLKLSQESM